MKKWLPQFKGNFARKPQGNDRAQVMAVANGEGDIAIVNSYYLGIMLSGSSGKKQLNAAKKVKVVFPNQKNRGVHVNISGAGRHARQAGQTSIKMIAHICRLNISLFIAAPKKITHHPYPAPRVWITCIWWILAVLKLIRKYAEDSQTMSSGNFCP